MCHASCVILQVRCTQHSYQFCYRIPPFLRTSFLRVPLSRAHRRDIIAIGNQILPEPLVFFRDGVLNIQISTAIVGRESVESTSAHLSNIREEEQSNCGSEDAERARDEERILARASLIGRILLHDREDIGSDKGADLANGCSNSVILAADGGRGGLGRNQPDVVAGTKLTQRQEDAGRRLARGMNFSWYDKTHP